MRRDKSIIFLKMVPGSYNEDSGDYETDTYDKDIRLASVTDASAVTLRHEYGEYKQGDLVVRIQGHLGYIPDAVQIGSKLYSIEMTRSLRRFQTFHLTEKQEVPA